MGVNGLWKILEEKGCCRQVPTRSLRNIIRTETCRVAADAFHMCYKFYSGEWTKSGSHDQNSIIQLAISRFEEIHRIFRSARIEMVLCTDGIKNKEKQATDKRTNIKDNGYRDVVKLYLESKEILKEHPEITKTIEEFRFLEDYLYVLEADYTPQCPENYEEILTQNIWSIKQLLKTTVFYPKGFVNIILDALVSKEIVVCDVPEISEGEKLCSILVALGYCQAVFSGDSDSIVFGTRCVIRSINWQTATVYFYEECIDKLKLRDEQFLWYCICIGTDFSGGAPGLAEVKGYKVVTEEGFDPHKLDLRFCGAMRTNVCIRAFRISEEEKNTVMNNITFRKIQEDA